MSEPTVERNDAKQRYDILVDGQRAGLTAYRDHGEQRVFYHTEIDPEFARQGLGTRLVEQALTDARASGKRIVAVCPYVAAFLKRHPEFADLADPATPRRPALARPRPGPTPATGRLAGARTRPP